MEPAGQVLLVATMGSKVQTPEDRFWIALQGLIAGSMIKDTKLVVIDQPLPTLLVKYFC